MFQMDNIDLKMPIYLVSLKQDKQRREKLKERFQETYPSFVHVEAVDGRELPAKEYFDKVQGYFDKYKRMMTPGELGCTLSHIKALELFLSSDNEFGLILEDDVIGSDNDIFKINDLILSLDDNTLLLCGGQEGLRSPYLFARRSEVPSVYEIAGFSYRFIHRTCCYVVSKNAARKILEYHRREHITLADKWSVFFVKSKVRILYSPILKHPVDMSESHIEKERAYGRKSVIEKIFSIDVFYIVARRVYWKVNTFVLYLLGYRKI